MKTLTITLNTAKETVRQPIFVILTLIGAFFLVLSIIIPYYTFGEDIKMVKDNGLAAILLLGLFLALWTASNTVAEDIEHRTAITLLSKPINRRQFIIGKFAGILLGVAVMFVILGLVFGAVVCYKVGYDAREGGYRTENPLENPQRPNWAERFREVEQVVPGLILTFFQIVVITALSVAISTRLPMVVNLVTCFSIYLLGHLAPVLVQASEGGFELIEFTARMLEMILPALEFFNVGPAVSTGSQIPVQYVLWNLLYCVMYTTICILVAFILFEDRDLA